MTKIFMLTIALYSLLSSNELEGKKVFETYCWGCHHQTAVAFGPPFSEIANKRSKEEIQAYIISPKSMYKTFGYRRSVMTQLELTNKELESISDYILLYKGK